MKHRDAKYKNLVKTHASSYRKKLKVNEEELRKAYRETRSVELGTYRHNNVYVCYDSIVNKIVEKWEPRDPKTCLEIIHSVHNKCNALLLEIILDEDRKITIENERQKNREANSNSKR